MRLVTYSWMTVVVAVVCAAIGWLGLAGWMAAVVVLASIAMHVAGNALGTRMREAADRERRARGPEMRPPSLPVVPAEPGRLERRETLGRLVPVSAGIGAVIGGLAGSMMLAVFTRTSAPGAILGGASSAVIGGLFGFLAASFVEILRTSLRDGAAAMAADRGAWYNRGPSEIPPP
jgi:hypothetical protein